MGPGGQKIRSGQPASSRSRATRLVHAGFVTVARRGSLRGAAVAARLEDADPGALGALLVVGRALLLGAATEDAADVDGADLLLGRRVLRGVVLAAVAQ